MDNVAIPIKNEIAPQKAKALTVVGSLIILQRTAENQNPLKPKHY